MHTLRLPLETGKQKDTILEKAFAAMNRCYNVIVSEAKKRLRMLRRDKAYKALKKRYGKAVNASNETERKQIGSLMQERINYYGLTKSSLESYIKEWQHKYSHLIGAQDAQAVVARVWQGVEKVLYDNGKDIHYSKLQELTTIAAKSWNGIKYVDRYHKEYLPKRIEPVYENEIFFYGTHFKVFIDWTDLYVLESLGKKKISFAQIERMMFNSGWKHYVILYIEGDAPIKYQSQDAVAGLDPGVSTEAAVFDDHCELVELAHDSKKYNKQIAELQRDIDRSVRASNPDNYNENGTIKKCYKTWKLSNNCLKKKRKLKTLYRKKADYIKHHQNEIANRFVRSANTFITEDMNFKALMKKAKSSVERSKKTVQIKKTNGTEQTIRLCKKRKRFGSSVNDRAPAQFISILERKCIQHGGKLIKVQTAKFKASQYNHDTNTYIKVPLSQRSKIIAGMKVQRDLYSAFLLKHSNKGGTKANRKSCSKDFEQFIKNHNQCIDKIKTSKKSYPACFGI